jgi:hypothetical protein
MTPATDAYIDERILFFADTRRLKVARIFSQVMQECEEKGLRVNAATLDRRLRALIDAGHLEAFGNVAKWGHSEVRLTKRPAVPTPPSSSR